MRSTKPGPERELDAVLAELRWLQGSPLHSAAWHLESGLEERDLQRLDRARRSLVEVEARLRHLRSLLDDLNFPEPPPLPPRLAYRSKVTVLDVWSARERRYWLGARAEGCARDEQDLPVVSRESPVGEALQGCRVGDERTLTAPGGHRTIRIVHAEADPEYSDPVWSW